MSRPPKRKVNCFVIEAKLVQDRGVDVVNVSRFSDRAHAHVVGRAVVMPPTDSAAGHPDRVAADVMIAAIRAGAVRRATHFTGPHDQRIVQQPRCFRSMSSAATG